MDALQKIVDVIRTIEGRLSTLASDINQHHPITSLARAPSWLSSLERVTVKL
jgi:hypothetical protein